ncbi:energy transducer TonB [Pedobacter sp. AW1-32]|uniref:energy transducer TonB n=1 Tax=Pedobacter sp. AW1-32 TaxID=3383026 RepID=UPI003FEE1BD2
MNNDWLDIDVLEDYLDGKLDAKAMHFVERQALEDPFVAEAIEGLRQSPKRKEHISLLQKQLYHRIANEPVKKKIWGITTQRLSIAATATVAFIAVSILFFMRETNRKNAETAQRKANGIEVTLDTSTQITASKKPLVDASPEVDKTAVIDDAIKESKRVDLAQNSSKFSKQTGKTALTFSRKETTLPTAAIDPALAQSHAFAAAPANSTRIVYNGNVVSQEGKPISGAIVKTADAKKVTATDVNGFFSLPVDSLERNKEILVKADGYDEKIVKPDVNALRAALTGDKSLNEIAMVTGSNGHAKQNIPAPKIVLKADQNLNGKIAGEISKPVPVSTIDYNQYLERNNKLYNAADGDQYIIVRFKVRKNGRPTRIEVIKSIDKRLDKEAKRLIEAGPDWVLPKNGTDTVEMSIRF